MEQDITNFLESGLGITVFFILIVWSFIWKGLALWRSARRGDKVWFIIFLIVNTVGILEIIYYFLISKKKKT